MKDSQLTPHAPSKSGVVSISKLVVKRSQAGVGESRVCIGVESR